jgi:hypothetical protein
MSDWEVEGVSGPQGIRTDEEPDLAGPAGEEQQKRLADARFDPAMLYSEIKSPDWRVGTTVVAEGVDHCAVEEGGVIRFFEPVPSGGHSNWSGDKGGAKSPWPFRAVKLSVEMLTPPTPTALFVEEDSTAVPPVTAHTELLVSHSQMLASIILRGFLTLELADIVILKKCPVSQIGGAGGAHFEGDHFGSASNMQQAWTNAFKLPDECIFDPDKGTTLKGKIDLNAADLDILGKLVSGSGWGSPFAKLKQLHYTAPVVAPPAPESWEAVTLSTPFFGVRLSLWGQRGLNIRAGRSSLVGATSRRR